jgi:cobaltochelatase CobT
VHPSALRADRQTIVIPPRGNAEAYHRLRTEVQREVGFLAQRLTNLLREETYLRYLSHFRSGKLHMAKLWRQRVGDYRLFQRPADRGRREAAFTLLVDESASMKGQDKHRTAAKTALLLGETLHQVGVPLEIIGFSTAEFEARAALKLGLTPVYAYRTTRCAPLVHRLYKRFDEPYLGVRTRLAPMEPRCNNWDEESLLFAFRRLQARTERTRILIVISDGQPNGDADCLIATVRQLEATGCRVIGVGIGADFARQIYRRAIIVSGFRQLAEALLGMLMVELKSAAGPRAGAVPAGDPAAPHSLLRQLHAAT